MKFTFKLKKLLKILLLCVIFGIVYSFSFTTYENIKVNGVFKEFKSRANGNVLVEEHPLATTGTYIRKYHEVSRVTLDEKNTKNVFMDDSKENLGQIGDIFATRQSPFPEIFGFHQFMSFYFGGHSAIKVDTNKLIESTGFPEDDETIFDIIFSNGKPGHGYSPTPSISSNYWFKADKSEYYYNNFYRSRYFGLRVRDPFLGEDLEGYEKLINVATSQAFQKYEDESLYNFLFFLNTRRKYYCTDLVSRVYSEAFERIVYDNEDYISKGYAPNLNDDGFITSVNDLLLSRDTFMHFYVEINEEPVTGLINGVNYNGEIKVVQNIYYLEDR